MVVTSEEKGRSREEGGEETERKAEGRTGIGEDSHTHQPQPILIGGHVRAHSQTCVSP